MQNVLTEKLLTLVVLAAIVIAAMKFGLIDRDLFTALLAVFGVRAGETVLRPAVKAGTDRIGGQQ